MKENNKQVYWSIIFLIVPYIMSKKRQDLNKKLLYNIEKTLNEVGILK